MRRPLELGSLAAARNDFPNQLNDALVFPAILRGTLDARAVTISDEMATPEGGTVKSDKWKNHRLDGSKAFPFETAAPHR